MVPASPRRSTFWGFTHICGQSRQNGKFSVLRKTVRKRLLAKLKKLKEELQPVAGLERLRSVLQDYFTLTRGARESCQS